MPRIALGWLQLKREKARLATALAGVGFAVLLVLMQLGFRDSMFESAVQYHRAWRFDVALMSPASAFIVTPASFSSRRLYQALGSPDVASVTGISVRLASWKNPLSHDSRNLFVIGVDGFDGAFADGEVTRQLGKLRKQDVVLFDERSRPEFGPIAELVRSQGSVSTELNHRRISVEGLYAVGTSFGINGAVVTSSVNFLRLFPGRDPGLIDIGLVRLEPGVDAEAAAARLRERLPEDVRVMTRAEFIEREKAYWAGTTPIGVVFTFGVVIAFLVGGIIVYQILFADVSDHMSEYATLKAMGYSNAYLSRVVIEQATILGLLGFLPGFALSVWLYGVAGQATRLPLIVSPARVVTVLALTIAMCAISGLIALRKVRALDPADVF